MAADAVRTLRRLSATLTLLTLGSHADRVGAQEAGASTPVSLPVVAPPVPLSPSDVAPAGALAARLARVVRDTMLANGLEVISVENHSVPLVMVMVVVHTGAFTQETGQVGVPHLFEHMLFKSYNSDGRTWGQAMQPLDIATYNGMTADESVRYFIVLPSDKADEGLSALANLVRDPSFRQDDLTE